MLGKRHGLRSNDRIKDAIQMLDNPPGRVRRIKPPKRTEPAEDFTVATIILRRNKALYLGNKSADPDLRFLNEMYYDSQERQLTSAESKRVLALITWLKGRQ
jgi:hypothetical protein